ncbi:hypothetical protein ACTA71_004675 [Dictyostelium dimigraforme]
MSNFQNQEINIGSVVLGDRSLSNGQYGDKKSIRHVDFDVPFSGVPKVSLGINFLDASSSDQTRIRCVAQNITTKGMDISFTTWNNNTVYDVAVDYVAVYNPRFRNSNNNNNTQTINQQRNQYNNENNNYYQQNQQSNYERNNDSEDKQQRRYQDNNYDNNNYNRNDDEDQSQPQSQNQSQGQSNNFNGRNVNIKSNKFNNYLRDNNGKGDMSPTARINETWTITSVSNNNGDLYYIHNRYNHYLSSNGDRVLVGEKNDSSVWKISQRKQGVYSIQNYKNSNYLSATDKSEAKTNVRVVNSWEEFTFNFV